MASSIDFNYEEISCDRNINDGNWSNGLQNFRFSVSSSGGYTWNPKMSYFLVEYAFGHENGANVYSPVESLKQSQKIALANDWVSNMYSGASFRMAGTDINVINNSFAQVSALKNRMKLKSGQIDFLSGDLSAWEPDFSKRLSKACIDGVFHRDGLIDASPYQSQASGPYNSLSLSVVLSCSGAALARGGIAASGVASYAGAGMQSQGVHPVGGNWLWLYGRYNGLGDIVFNAADAVIVQSFTYTFPATSATGDNNAIIDGTLIKVGDTLKLDVPGGAANAGYVSFINGDFTVSKSDIVGDAVKLTINIGSTLCTIGVFKAMYDAAGADKFTLVSVTNGSAYTQADPRSNVINSMVVWQPPLSIFDQTGPYFTGDMQLVLTPNSNWRTSAIESAVGTYETDIVHGTDYAFGVKSLRFYIARCRTTEEIPREIGLTMQDFIVSNKQLSNSLDFTVPPSTQSIVVFIQDSAASTMTKLPASRFKCRQNSHNGDLTNLNKYGPWAHTHDEMLKSIMITFSNITKPQTLIQNTIAVSNNNNTMLQRYLMTQQMDKREDTESYYDWLSNGPYFLWNFERDSESLGTYVNLKLNYEGEVPWQGSAVGDIRSNVNVFVVAIYNRDVSLTYSEFGSIIAVQTAMQ